MNESTILRIKGFVIEFKDKNNQATASKFLSKFYNALIDIRRMQQQQSSSLVDDDNILISFRPSIIFSFTDKKTGITINSIRSEEVEGWIEETESIMKLMAFKYTDNIRQWLTNE